MSDQEKNPAPEWLDDDRIRRLRGYVASWRSLPGLEADVEDILQETLLRVLSVGPSKKPKNPDQFLRVVARGMLRNHLRARRAEAAESVEPLADSLAIQSGEIKRETYEVLRYWVSRNVAPDLELHFDPSLSPTEVRRIVRSLADYYRECGGLGLEFRFDVERAEVVREGA